jgi:isopenicillin N synthase-like dioxygenase
MLPNIWPDVPEFKETFQLLFTEMDKVGARILSSIARYLGFARALVRSSDCGRELYFTSFALSPDRRAMPKAASAQVRMRILTSSPYCSGAEEAGLQILRPDGSWMDVSPPQGGLAVNVGDMLQRLTNHMLPSTTHRVVNPSGRAVAV